MAGRPDRSGGRDQSRKDPGSALSGRCARGPHEARAFQVAPTALAHSRMAARIPPRAQESGRRSDSAVRRRRHRRRPSPRASASGRAGPETRLEVAPAPVRGCPRRPAFAPRRNCPAIPDERRLSGRTRASTPSRERRGSPCSRRTHRLEASRAPRRRPETHGPRGNGPRRRAATSQARASTRSAFTSAPLPAPARTSSRHRSASKDSGRSPRSGSYCSASSHRPDSRSVNVALRDVTKMMFIQCCSTPAPVRPIPSRSRNMPFAPSATMTYSARMTSSMPDARARMTPSTWSSCRTTRDQLGVEAHVGTATLGVIAQDGFEDVLVAGRGIGRAEAARIGPRRLHHPLHVGVGQGLPTRDSAGALIASAVRSNLALDPELAKDLHAARGDPRELVLNRCARMALDEQAPDVVVRERQRTGEAAQASADDEDWSRVVIRASARGLVQRGRRPRSRGRLSWVRLRCHS